MLFGKFYVWHLKYNILQNIAYEIQQFQYTFAFAIGIWHYHEKISTGQFHKLNAIVRATT
jgi:hypothetical protein